MDVSRGVAVGVDDTRPVYLASGVKLFVLCELFRQRRAGTLSFDEELPFDDDDVRDGSPTMNREPLHARYTVRQLLKWMVRDSDNAAFDLLLARVGEDAVRATARRFGDVGPVLSTLATRRAVYGRLDPRARSLTPAQIRDVRWRDSWHPRLDLLQKHIGPPFARYTFADHDRAWADHYASGASSAPLATVGALLVALTRGEVVSAADDAEILALLRDVKTSDRRIVGALPADVVVAPRPGRCTSACPTSAC